MAVIEAPLLWGTHELQGDTDLTFRLGPLTVHTRAIASELLVAYTLDPESNGTPEDSAALNWSRWALRGTAKKLSVLPVFPDLPVVVRPENPFRIVKGARAKVYIRVPVWLRLELVGNTKQPVCDIPTLVLSKTWFGSFEEGELCYWISSSARQDVFRDPERPHYAICPVDIVNKAEEDLPVDKICHRVDALSLYNENGQLWGSETRVAFRGGNEVSQIRTTPGTPSEVTGGVLLTSARNSARDSFKGRTFRTLQSLSDMGIRIIEQIT